MLNFGATSKISEFYSCVEERNHVENLAIQPHDWIYRNLKVSYNLNSYGHRSKEISDLKSDYFLVGGCSYTLGYGLRLQDSYVYKIALDLNLDYYNASVNGSGSDFLFLNILSFVSQNLTNKPRFIILQWPEINRCFFKTPLDYRFANVTFANSDVKEAYEILSKCQIIESQSIMYRSLLLDILNSHKIPIFEVFIKDYTYPWVNPNDNKFTFDMDKNTNLIILDGMQHTGDKARDCLHPGINVNKIWADSVTETLRKHGKYQSSHKKES